MATATAIEAVKTDRVTLMVRSGETGLRVSPEAFWEVCVANPVLRLTRKADGELLLMAPAGTESDARNLSLAAQLWYWNEAHRLGRAFGPSAGFILPNGFIHSPDAAWVAGDRWATLTPDQRERFAPICPDFVAELMSPSDTRPQTRQMVEPFMAHGARLGWLIDRRAGEVEIHRPGRPYEVLSRATSLSGEDVLPGFVLDLRGILFD